MKRFKKKLITGLTGILLAAATIFPSKAQERVILDNFSQPNDTTLNYYGSGDVLLDRTIDWKDAERLDSLINYTFTDTSDDRLLDRADINGDGLINNQDKQILEEELNNYFPSHWNKLSDLEKQGWFKLMVEIDKTDTIITSECTEFANPFAINFHGFKSLEGVDPEDFKYKFSKNNRFNIPVYTVGTRTDQGSAHSINGVLIGDNPFEFSNWYFIDPGYEDDKPVNPGEWDMAYNSDVIVDYLLDINPDDGGLSSLIMISWHLDETGNPTLLYTPYIKHIVKSNPSKDTIAPKANLSISDSSYYNSNVTLEYLVKENQTFLDSAYYELNGNKKNIDCSVYATDILNAPVDSISGIEPLASQEGEYNLVFFVNDIAKPKGNEVIEERYFVIDKTPPITSDDVPTEWQDSDFDVTLTPNDELSGVASTKYCIGSTNDCTPNIEYTSPVRVSDEGVKYIKYFSTDKAGNNQPIVSKEIKLDKTAPEINIASPESKEYVNEVNNFVFTITDSNLDSCFYSVDNGQTKTYFPCTSGLEANLNITSDEGSNNWALYTKDKAKNTSEQNVAFEFIPDAIEDTYLGTSFKAYPNPTSGSINFEFYLDNPKDLRFKMYNMAGKELENIVVEANPGDNKVSYDFSKYSSGIYLYRFEGTDRKAKTGKIIKR